MSGATDQPGRARRVRVLTLLLGLGVAAGLSTGVSACGADDGADRSISGEQQEFRLPALPPPTEFASAVDHPSFPLHPGARWVYRARTSDGVETIRVSVERAPRVVAGITATVVRDRAFVDGVLTEDTHDWYAQDRAGNVWYLGEATVSYEPGAAPDHTGSWETGVDGARAGLLLPADPKVGDRYQQEYRRGVAEDRGEILALDATGQVPWGSFTHAIRTRDTTPLEPDLVEFKYYVSGVGVVLEEEDEDRLELIAYSPG